MPLDDIFQEEYAAHMGRGTYVGYLLAGIVADRMGRSDLADRALRSGYDLQMQADDPDQVFLAYFDATKMTSPDGPELALKARRRQCELLLRDDGLQGNSSSHILASNALEYAERLGQHDLVNKAVRQIYDKLMGWGRKENCYKAGVIAEERLQDSTLAEQAYWKSWEMARQDDDPMFRGKVLRDKLNRPGLAAAAFMIQYNRDMEGDRDMPGQAQYMFERAARVAREYLQRSDLEQKAQDKIQELRHSAA